MKMSLFPEDNQNVKICLPKVKKVKICLSKFKKQLWCSWSLNMMFFYFQKIPTNPSSRWISESSMKFEFCIFECAMMRDRQIYKGLGFSFNTSRQHLHCWSHLELPFTFHEIGFSNRFEWDVQQLNNLIAADPSPSWVEPSSWKKSSISGRIPSSLWWRCWNLSISFVIELAVCWNTLAYCRLVQDKSNWVGSILNRNIVPLEHGYILTF